MMTEVAAATPKKTGGDKPVDVARKRIGGDEIELSAMAHDNGDQGKSRAPERFIDEHRRAVTQEAMQAYPCRGVENGVRHERHRAAAERVERYDDKLHHAGQKALPPPRR